MLVIPLRQDRQPCGSRNINLFCLRGPWTLLRSDHREPSGNSGNVRQAIEADGAKGMTIIGHRICGPLEQVLC
jgi:hypothetical protein